MALGGLATTKLGAALPGQMGGDRMRWTWSTASVPLFAVIFVDEVSNSYYHSTLPVNDPINVAGRLLWYEHVAAYEERARAMTDAQLWHKLIILLVHVEGSSFRHLDPLMPRPLGGEIVPYPSHINPPDSVPMARWRSWDQDQCNLDVFRLTLEQAASHVYPTVMYIDISGSMYEGTIDPGFSEWKLESPVDITEYPIRNEAWVQWATEILGRFVP